MIPYLAALEWWMVFLTVIPRPIFLFINTSLLVALGVQLINIFGGGDN